MLKKGLPLTNSNKVSLDICSNQYKSMVHQTSTITAANGKIFVLKQTLNCSNYGIHVATCSLCHKQYIGQTTNKFSKRWCHRFIWNQFKFDNIDDKAALLQDWNKSLVR